MRNWSAGSQAGNAAAVGQQEFLGAAGLLRVVVAAEGTGAGYEKRQLVVVGVGCDVGLHHISFGANILRRTVADIVQQKATVIQTLLQGVVHVGIVRAVGPRLLHIGVGIDFVDRKLRILGSDSLPDVFRRRCEVGVAAAAGVGIVGQQGHAVAPVAANVVVQQVAAHHIAFDFVDQVFGLVGILRRQAPHRDIHRGATRKALAIVEICEYVVGRYRYAIVVKRTPGLVGYHRRYVAAHQVLVVVGPFAQQQQVARHRFFVGAYRACAKHS